MTTDRGARRGQDRGGVAGRAAGGRLDRGRAGVHRAAPGAGRRADRAARGGRGRGGRGAPAHAELIVVAVKPQDIGPVLAELAPVLRPGTLVVSLCAGLPTALFEGALPEGTPVVRVMPNTPMLVGEAMSAISAGPPRQRRRSWPRWRRCWRSVGRVVRVPGVPAGRRHRAVRLRPGVLLLPGRGHDRRRDPARAAARRGGRPDRAVGVRGGARCCASPATTR